MPEQIIHSTVNGRYRVVIEQGASTTKNQLGWKVEANADDKAEAIGDASWLMLEVQKLTDNKEKGV